MRKRILCLLTCLSLMLTLLPTAALAVEGTTGADAQAAQTAEYALETVEVRYAGNQLEDDLLTAYKALVAGIESAETSITVENCSLTQENLQTVMNAVLSDYPEFFWVNGSATSSVTRNNTVIAPTYTHASSLDTDRTAVETAATALLADLPAGSDYETALAIHDWLADHVQYVANDDDQNIYGALVGGKAVCAGYARAYQYLLNQAGIEAWYVTGKSDKPGTSEQIDHAWTAVHLKTPTDVWYYVDVTWDDQEDTLFHAYFLQNYTSMKDDHTFDADTTAGYPFKLPDTGFDDNYYFRTAKGGTVIESFNAATVADGMEISSATTYTGHFYVTGNVADFISALFPDENASEGDNNNANSNRLAIADALQVTGQSSLSSARLGREVILTLTTSTAIPNITISEPGPITYTGSAVTAGASVEGEFDLTYTYTGSKKPSVTWYKDSSGSRGEPLSAAPKDAGTYWIVVSAEDVSGEVTKQFTIDCAQYTYNGPTVSTKVTVGDAYPTGGSVQAVGVGSEEVSGTLAWFTDADCTAAVEGTFTNAGSITTLYWKFTPDADAANYVQTPETGSKQFTVSALPAQTVTFTGVTGNAVTKAYGDAAFTYTATSDDSNGVITYDSSNTDVATVDSSSGLVTINAAGTTTITATAAATSTHAAGSAQYTLTVNKKEIIATPALAPKAYDGTTDATVASVTFAGLKDGESLNMGTDYTATAVFDNANAGSNKTVTVTVTLLDTAAAKNYTLSDSGTYTLSGQSITQAEWDGETTISLDVPTTGTTGTLDLSSYLPADGQTVNTSVTREPETFITAASVTGSMLSYTTAEAVDQTSGTITVQVTSTNYEEFSITVNVTAKTLSASVGAAIISGIVDTPVSPVTITVTLVGDTFAQNLSGNWITNLPNNLTQTVERTGDTTATITVSGTPSEVATGTATIVIPAKDLTTHQADSLTVSGTVGYAIVPASYSMTVVPTAAVGTTLLDFGEVAFGSTGVASQTFTLTNTGNQTITGLAVTNSSEVFQVTLGAETLAPGEDTIATVTVNPDVNVGTHLIKFLFTYSNGDAEGTAQVKITQAPATTATATGSVLYSDTTEQKISILNAIQSFLAGDETLNYGQVTVTEGTDKLSATAAQPTVGSDGQLSYYLADNLPAEEGTITMTVEVTGLTNYEKVTVTVTVQIATTAPVVTRTITFNANGGSGSMSPVTVADGASYTLPACDFTAPSGMRFAGWRYGITGNQYSAGYTFTTVGSNMAFYAVWETIPTTNPGGSTGGSSSGSTSSSGSSGSVSVSTPTTAGGVTTVITEVKPTVTGTTAAAVITSTSMDKAVDGALTAAVSKGTSPTVEISVDTSERADTLEVSLPTNSLEKLGRHAGAALTITSGVAEVTLDSDAISAVADQAGSRVTLSVEPVSRSELNSLQRAVVGDASVLDLRLMSSNQVITNFRGGSATVTVPYELPSSVFAHEVTVWYLDDDGKMTACATDYDSRTGLVTFTTPHFSLYVIGTETGAAVFGDVPASHWAYSEISWANASGYMTGKSAGTFDPNGFVTRQQVWMILARMAGAAPADMTGAKTWAVDNGISDGSNPGGAVTRQQLAALVYRFAQKFGYNTAGSADLSIYPDASALPEYAAAPLAWAVANGIVTGTTQGTLNGGGTATRAQFAVILWRFVNNNQV